MPTIDEAFGPRPPLTTEAACKMVVRSGAIVVILVEGWSDQAALEALAHRRGSALQWGISGGGFFCRFAR